MPVSNENDISPNNPYISKNDASEIPLGARAFVQSFYPGGIENQQQVSQLSEGLKLMIKNYYNPGAAAGNWGRCYDATAQGTTELLTGDKVDRGPATEVLTTPGGDTVTVSRDGAIRIRTMHTITIRTTSESTTLSYPNDDLIEVRAGHIARVKRYSKTNSLSAYFDYPILALDSYDNLHKRDEELRARK